jgi:hypothetical protein
MKITLSEEEMLMMLSLEVHTLDIVDVRSSARVIFQV